MSQLNVLTREQARVRALLERYPNVSHSAVDVARYFGMDVRTALVALRELRRRGYARRGPARADETDETELYDPDDTGP
jgi:DNA-binding MarR family transcriptional regulator